MQTLLGAASDFNNVLVGQSYNPKYQEICGKNYTDRIVPFLQKFNQHYESQGTIYMAGDSLTIADIKLYENIQHCQHHYADCLEAVSGVKAFKAQMDSLDFVQAYQKSDRYFATPFNNPFRAAYP